MTDGPKFALPPDWQRHAELRTLLAILADGARRVLNQPPGSTPPPGADPPAGC